MTESWAFDGLCSFRPAQDDTTVQYGINDKSLAEHSSLSFAPAHPPKLRSSFNDTNTIVVSGFDLSSFSVLAVHLRYYLMKSDTTDYSNPANFEKLLGARAGGVQNGVNGVNLLAKLGTVQGEAGREDNDHRDQPQRSVGWGQFWGPPGDQNGSDGEEPD